MVHCTIAMPNQYDQQNINIEHPRMHAQASALLYDARARPSERAHASVKQHTSHITKK